ncbi:hypothetical protein LIA77_08424 [Sarocladium implicatum]|nr:hypothetical protein LIA77_08424 [Sarocladium implicatum]
MAQPMSRSTVPSTVGLFGTQGGHEYVIRTVNKLVLYIVDAFNYNADLQQFRVFVTPDPHTASVTPTIYRIEEYPARGQGFRLVQHCSHKVNSAEVARCVNCDRGLILGSTFMDNFLFKSCNVNVVDWLVQAVRQCGAYGVVQLGEEGTKDLQYYVDNRPKGLVPPPPGHEPVKEFLDTLNECVQWTEQAFRQSEHPHVRRMVSESSYTFAPGEAPKSDWAQIFAQYMAVPRSESSAGPSFAQDPAPRPLRTQGHQAILPAPTGSFNSRPVEPHHGRVREAEHGSVKQTERVASSREHENETDDSDGQRTPRARSPKRPVYWDPVQDSSKRSE